MDTAYYAGHYLEVFQIAQLTGEIMLKNGAETYRVEDTITRILKDDRLLSDRGFYDVDRNGHLYVRPYDIADYQCQARTKPFQSSAEG